MAVTPGRVPVGLLTGRETVHWAIGLKVWTAFVFMYLILCLLLIYNSPLHGHVTAGCRLAVRPASLVIGRSHGKQYRPPTCTRTWVVSVLRIVYTKVDSRIGRGRRGLMISRWLCTCLKGKKLSYCWETVRRESMPRIAEMDVEVTT